MEENATGASVCEAEVPELSKPGQVAALAALLEGVTIAEAGQRAGVNERTVRRWLREPEFRRCWNEGRAMSVQQAVTRVQGALQTSVDQTISVLNDAATPAGARGRTLKILFDISRDAENIELSRRFDELEMAVKEAAAQLGERYGVSPEDILKVK